MKLANERFDGIPWVPVDEDNWVVRLESWDLAKLRAPERKRSTVKLPQFDGPIVVVEFRGRAC